MHQLLIDPSDLHEKHYTIEVVEIFIKITHAAYMNEPRPYAFWLYQVEQSSYPYKPSWCVCVFVCTCLYGRMYVWVWLFAHVFRCVFMCGRVFVYLPQALHVQIVRPAVYISFFSILKQSYIIKLSTFYLR